MYIRSIAHAPASQYKKTAWDAQAAEPQHNAIQSMPQVKTGRSALEFTGHAVHLCVMQTQRHAIKISSDTEMGSCLAIPENDQLQLQHPLKRKPAQLRLCYHSISEIDS